MYVKKWQELFLPQTVDKVVKTEQVLTTFFCCKQAKNVGIYIFFSLVMV
jgi:hypothetical protein